MTDWSDRCVPQAARLHPYIPGKPVSQLLRETGLTEAVKLASNENADGMPPAALHAMQRACCELNRYPDGDARALKEALADYHGCGIEHILPGNGSNEVLELLIRCFAGVGDEVIYSRRGFVVYALATTAAGAQAVVTEEDASMGHDLAAMQAAITPRTKVICIANPNNPTGTLLSLSQLQAFLDQVPPDVVVILDEAYHEYVRHQLGDTLTVLRHPGLVVTRTFSKAYGLAGARIGYAVADARLLACVNRFREPFNVNSIAQAGAIAALQSSAWVEAHVQRTLAERQRLEAALAKQHMLAWPSHGNFVLLRHHQALTLHARLEQHGIITRPQAACHMPDILRVSVGSKTENTHFLEVLAAVSGDL